MHNTESGSEFWNSCVNIGNSSPAKLECFFIHDNIFDVSVSAFNYKFYKIEGIHQGWGSISFFDSIPILLVSIPIPIPQLTMIFSSIPFPIPVIFNSNSEGLNSNPNYDNTLLRSSFKLIMIITTSYIELLKSSFA